MTAMGKGVRVNVFPGGCNWPLFVGRETGFFAPHVDEACDILMANVPDISAALARARYTLLLRPASGFSPGAGARPAGVRAALDLHS